jgi:hypothetical protein
VLQPDYRISEAESTEATKIWLNEQQYRAMSEEEREMIDVLMDADKLGRWPVTVSEVHDHWKQENHESERRRIASWRSDYVFTERDFTALAEEDSGPMFEFVNTAKHLKDKSGLYPAVAQVRAEMKRNEKSL